jgi:hypothetical protein
VVVKIKKGNHYSNRWWLPSFTFRSEISGSFKFCGDFNYTIQKQGDTNKLVGVSDNFWGHHKDSLRIGWRYYKGSLELMAIVYNDGKRTITKLMDAQENELYSYAIYLTRGLYWIELKDASFNFKRTSNYSFLRYILKPYFGGETKAPKNFKFELKWRTE